MLKILVIVKSEQQTERHKSMSIQCHCSFFTDRIHYFTSLHFIKKLCNSHNENMVQFLVHLNLSYLQMSKCITRGVTQEKYFPDLSFDSICKNLFSLRDFLPLTFPNVQSTWIKIFQFTVNILFKRMSLHISLSLAYLLYSQYSIFPPCYNSDVTGFYVLYNWH